MVIFFGDIYVGGHILCDLCIYSLLLVDLLIYTIKFEVTKN